MSFICVKPSKAKRLIISRAQKKCAAAVAHPFTARRLCMSVFTRSFFCIIFYLFSIFQNVADTQARLQQLDANASTYLNIILSHTDPFRETLPEEEVQMLDVDEPRLSKKIKTRRRLRQPLVTDQDSTQDEEKTGGVLLFVSVGA